MYLWIDNNKYGHNTLYVKKSFRKENGKVSTKTVENLGRLEDLSKIHPDPIAWAKEYIEELNKKEKECTKTVILPFSPTTQIESNKDVLLDGGYLFLKHIYHNLNLDYICKKISNDYDFKYNLNNILSTLVINRILFPGSKRATYEKSTHSLQPPTFSLKDMYRSLKVIADSTDQIQSNLYRFSKDMGKRNDHILYYDCTNFYCEIEEENGIRKYGVSKENRPNPIVQMGLFLDGDGIPLAFCVFDGNTNEQKTLRPLERQIINDFELSKFIVCTDAGLSSLANRKFNNFSDKAFVTTQSIKKMKDFQKEWALDTTGWSLCDKKEKYDISEILSDEDKMQKYYNSIFYKERWFNENDLEQRYIVSFSIKNYLYQRKIRNEQIERAAMKLKSANDIEHYRATDYKRFIQKSSITADGELADKKIYSINTEKIKDEEQYDGFYAVATNLEGSVEKIIEINKGRWEIEESFRFMKSEFDTRPIYLSRDDHIKAHFTICFLALTIFRYLENILDKKYTGQRILKELRDFKFYKVQSEGYIPVYTRTELTDSLHKKFGFRTDTQIVPNAEMKNIFSKIKKCRSHTTL